MEYKLILLLALPALATAHLAGGTDVEHGNYTIDLGYEPAPVKEGDEAKLQFTLLQNGSTVRPDEAWVRISKDDIVFTGTLAPGATRNFLVTQTFDEPGTYDVTVRFSRSETLAEHTFHLDVQSGGRLGDYSWGIIMAGIEALVLVLLIVMLVYLHYREK